MSDKIKDATSPQVSVGGQEDDENDYSEDFVISSASEKITSAFSNSGEEQKEGDDDEELNSDAAVPSLMSTIDEEQTPSASAREVDIKSGSSSEDHKQKSSRSTREDSNRLQGSLSKPTHSDSDRVPDELKDLQHFFEGGDDDISVSSGISISISKTESRGDNGASAMSNNNKNSGQDHDNDDSKSQSNSVSESQSGGIAEILQKLERLTNAQNILENVLEGEAEMNEADIEAALHQVLSQLPSTPAATNLNDTANPSEDQLNWLKDSDHSLSVEMAALQNLIDHKEDPTEENFEHNNTKGSLWEEREFNAVIKEYEELERTLTQSNDTGANSCDEQESIRSDADHRASQVPSNNNIPEVASISATALTKKHNQPAASPFLPPEVPFLSQPNSSNSASSSSLTISNRALDRSKHRRDQQHHKVKEVDRPTLSPYVSSKHIPPVNNNKQTDFNNKGMLQSPLKSSWNPANSQPAPLKGSKSTFAAVGRSGISADERPITPTSPLTLRSPRTLGNSGRRYSGGSQLVRSSRNGGGEGAGNNYEENERNLKKIEKLQAEVTRQETLITAYQEDNQKLYNELRSKEKEHLGKEAEWEEIVNSLKTEIATMKIHRLIPSPSRPSSAQKAELEKLREESASKSLQMTELRKEILVLRNNLAEASKSPKQGRANIIAQEREKESQKTIRNLNKQVRTLQKILYRKDPSAVSALSTAQSRDDLNCSQEFINMVGTGGSKDAHVAVLESRITELENDLAKADNDAKDRLRDFQARLNGLKGRYEDQTKDYELKLEEASVKIQLLETGASQATIQELKSRFEKSQTEVTHLKVEINKYKRELEIAQRSSVSTAVTQATAKQDAGTLSLAIKSFKSELAEKEKEIIRMKKELADLNKTNNTLKREREKYLNLTNALSLPGSVPSHPVRQMQRTKSDVAPKGGKKTGNNNKEKDGLGTLLTDSRSPTRPATSGGSATAQMLQSALEYERNEFEQLIDHKKKEIEERDKIIFKLREELEELKHGKEVDTDEYSKARMLNELRSRVNTQNELISKLKDHIAYYRRIEGEYLRLKQEKGQTEVEMKELKQKLDLCQNLNRPENEVLELLSKKFDELNSRYLHRERQMDSIINRLAVRTGASGSFSPRLTSSSGGHLDGDTGSSEFDLRQLSPSLSMHLLNASSGATDLPEV